MSTIFSRLSQHTTMCTPLNLASFTQHNALNFIMLLNLSVVHFSLLPSSISLWEWNMMCSFICQLKEVLGCFQFWVVINKVIVNTCVQVFVWTYVPYHMLPRSGISVSFDKFCVSFYKKLPISFPKWPYHFACMYYTNNIWVCTYV